MSVGRSGGRGWAPAYCVVLDAGCSSLHFMCLFRTEAVSVCLVTEPLALPSELTELNLGGYLEGLYILLLKVKMLTLKLATHCLFVCLYPTLSFSVFESLSLCIFLIFSKVWQSEEGGNCGPQFLPAGAMQGRPGV